MIIIYKEDNDVKVLIPCTTELTIKQIGEKDIPNGVPFWIVEQNSLPINIPQELWKLENMGEASGYGKRI